MGERRFLLMTSTMSAGPARLSGSFLNDICLFEDSLDRAGSDVELVVAEAIFPTGAVSVLPFPVGETPKILFQGVK